VKSRTLSVLVLLALALTPGCSAARPTLEDLAQAAGCTYVRTTSDTEQGAQVLRVRVRDCAPGSSVQTIDERAAAAAWRYLGRPVDRVEVVTYPTGLSASVTSFHGEDLVGQHPVDSLARPPLRRDGNNPLWLLLPFAYLTVAATTIAAVRQQRRSGVVLFVLRR
jgi:hypothetical protein